MALSANGRRPGSHPGNGGFNSPQRHEMSASSSWPRIAGFHPADAGSNPAADANRMPPPTESVPRLRTEGKVFDSPRGHETPASLGWQAGFISLIETVRFRPPVRRAAGRLGRRLLDTQERPGSIPGLRTKLVSTGGRVDRGKISRGPSLRRRRMSVLRGRLLTGWTTVPGVRLSPSPRHGRFAKWEGAELQPR